MSFVTWLRQRKTLASATALAVLVAAPVTVAVLHTGFPLSEVDLRAWSVWVTNSDLHRTARLNTQIKELDSKVAAQSSRFDVLQDGDDVFVHDADSSNVQRVDPAFATLGQKIDAPGAVVSYGGGRIAIVQPVDGALWVLDATSALQFDPSAPPLAVLGAGGAAVVAQDGSVIAVSTKQNAMLELRPGQGDLERKATVDAVHFELTAVGPHGVLLDRGTNSIIFSDGANVTVDEPVLRLQQPGPQRDTVLVATGSGLLEVGTGGPRDRFDAGVAEKNPDAVAAPVVLGTCLHGAWAAGAYLAVCKDREPKVQKLAGLSPDSRLTFRVNRNVVALNETTGGRIWTVQDAELVELIDPDWDMATPPEDEDSPDDPETTVLPNFEQAVNDRSEENHAPVASADQLGARPGKTVILDVLANDTDADGDILTISQVTPIPETSGKLELIEAGRALQFVPSETASGTVSFRYAITDGRAGGTAETTVDVAVRPIGSSNNQPVQSGTSAVIVETGRTISYNVLADWFDPDGDDLILSSATATGSAFVRYSPDGLVTFTQQGSELGPTQVELVVSDGQVTTVGTFVVDVKAPGETSPVAVPDFVRTFPGRPADVSPLSNDLSPSGEVLTLGKVTSLDGGLVADLDLDRGVVTVTGGAPGTHYLEYEVFAGSKQSKGLIRVDVSEDPDEPLPPIAVKDTAYLRPNQPVMIAVLANDLSPSGAVLGVQRLDVPADAATQLSVELLSSTLVRITAPSGMTEPMEFRYTISDGVNTASAGVSVVPIPELTRHQAPIAAPDTTKVRVGDIASVAVLDNDFHPDGARMLLDTRLVEARVGDGLAFVTGDQVRLQAPTTPGTYSITYRVTDAFQESATATVGFTVLARDAETNEPPNPKPITARVFQGAILEVEVPLDGIDPDGDSVTFFGTGAPLLGAIAGSTSTSFIYQAYDAPTAGTDTFSYEVHDAFGASAIGQVRIAVIPRDGTAPPSAVDDEVQLRPERVSTVPVLANDSDPNGYEIRLLPELLEVQEGIEAKVQGDSVVVESTEPGTYSVRYQVSNGKGPAVDAFIIVTVSEDAPLQPPIAFDQYIDPKGSVGQRTMKVDVLHDAQNPGGLRTDLVVTAEGPNRGLAEVDNDGFVTVTLGDTREAIAYRLTNELDELSAMAFIIVPRFTDSEPPFLREDLDPQTVAMNGSITWKLEDIIEVPSGRPARIADADSATAGRQDPKVDMVEGPAILRYTPEKDFRGKTVVTFKVTDGDSADDPNAVTIQLPVTVGDATFRDVPPVFSDQVIEVQPGEAAVSFDLRSASSHPNPALVSEFVYENIEGPDGPLKATISGSTLNARTDSTDLSLTPAVFTFDVRLGDLPPTKATVTVKAVASTRPLPQAIEDVEPEGRSTSSYVIPVLDNDFNPFATEGRPLRVTGVEFEGDNLGATRSSSESSVTVSTGTAKSGTISLIYTVIDAVDRPVQGRITIVVASAPEPVTSISLSNPGSETVTAVFQPPASSNGAEITSYTARISGTPGMSEQPCAAGSSCTFTGRTNGAVQTIEIGATNKVGTTWSTQSTITPYGTPSIPTNPVLNTNSATATATITPTWSGPVDAGGGSITYEWEYTAGTSGNGSVAGTSAPGRSVGQGDYTFRVRACNPGGCSAFVSASRHIDAALASIVLTKGSFRSGTAYYFHINAQNFTPNATFSVVCYSDDGAGEVQFGTASYQGNETTALRFDGAGNYNGDVSCWDGFGNINRGRIGSVWSNYSDF